jgi:hypothetical protein
MVSLQSRQVELQLNVDVHGTWAMLADECTQAEELCSDVEANPTSTVGIPKRLEVRPI